MGMMTLPQMFAPLLAGRYTGSPGILWRTLHDCWRGPLVLTDEEVDILLFGTAVETVVEGQGHDLEVSCLMDDLADAIRARDQVAMRVHADRAEVAGVNPELCDLTLRALLVQYPQ